MAVAISTTGHHHRMRFLETAVRNWRAALPLGSPLFVTVDGSLADAERVRRAIQPLGASVYRVGRPKVSGLMDNNHRLGVSVNKNTGLELLMDKTSVPNFFLSDDDASPLNHEALELHTRMANLFGVKHSMVCWGKSRLESDQFGSAARWSWPRGVVLYMHRDVVTRVGGMDERFGAGGHEHAEYSQRIRNAGFTPAPFVSPIDYALDNATAAKRWWHCEDMARTGEPLGSLGSRRRAQTTITRRAADWSRIHKIMAEREGSADFVSFRAHENGRASATLCTNLMGQGAGGQK